MITVEEVLDSNSNITDVINLGVVSNKVLSKIFKLYKYIEVDCFWYDDMDNPKKNTWIDIEGIGYGWLWLGYKRERSNRKLIKELHRLAKDTHKNEIIYTAIDNGIRTYWWSLNDMVMQVRLSDMPLDWF